jgi:hypothetical protein
MSHLRMIAFLCMQIGSALLFVFAAHLLLFLFKQDRLTFLALSAVAVTILYLFILTKFIKKTHSWRATCNYWTAYEVSLSRRNATSSLAFLAGAALISTVTAFRLWPEICGGLALLSVSWLLIWQLAAHDQAGNT